MRAHTRICNTYSFSTATMIRESASLLRYMYIAVLVHISKVFVIEITYFYKTCKCRYYPTVNKQHYKNVAYFDFSGGKAAGTWWSHTSLQCRFENGRSCTSTSVLFLHRQVIGQPLHLLNILGDEICNKTLLKVKVKHFKSKRQF
jgi:hypothetical protein